MLQLTFRSLGLKEITQAPRRLIMEVASSLISLLENTDRFRLNFELVRVRDVMCTIGRRTHTHCGQVLELVLHSIESARRTRR